MPNIPMPCLEPHCFNNVVARGRCAIHQKTAFPNNNRSERLPADWRTRRSVVLRRDSKFCEIHERIEAFCYVCNECGADTVDHKIPNDDDSLENLAAIHDRNPNSKGEHCHRKKTALEGNEAIRQNKPKKPWYM